MLSVLDLFRVGLGPSSSHTVGPMRIAKRFLREARKSGHLRKAERVEIELQGSLALTGIGHGTDKAVILGLLGFAPETAEPDAAEAAFHSAIQTKQLHLGEDLTIPFNAVADILYRGDIVPDLHPNGMVLRLFGSIDKAPLFTRVYYSTGGGFISSARRLSRPATNDVIEDKGRSPFSFGSADKLLTLCTDKDMTIDALILANEDQRRPRETT